MDTSIKNLRNIKWLSYSLTFIMGVAVVLPFVIKDAAASYFHTTTANMGYVFGFFMFGVMFFEWANGFIVKYISIRKEIYLIATGYILLNIAMYFLHNAHLLIPILILQGMVFGMVTTLPNYIIVSTFNGSDRSSKLNRIDFWFSVGSLVYPIVAGVMIDHKFSWQDVYLSVVVVILWILYLCYKCNLPNISDQIAGDSKQQQYSKWNVNIWLIGIAIFFYFVSYVGYTYWLSDYIVKGLHMSDTVGDFGESLFWTTYALGCLISSFVVRYIAIHKYIIISCLVSILAYFLIYQALNIAMLYFSVSLLGLACSTVYSSSISFGTQVLEKPSPRVVSFFVVSSGIGTYLAEIFSTWINTHLGMAILTFVSGVMMLIATLIYIFVASKAKIYVGNNNLH